MPTKSGCPSAFGRMEEFVEVGCDGVLCSDVDT